MSKPADGGSALRDSSRSLRSGKAATLNRHSITPVQPSARQSRGRVRSQSKRSSPTAELHTSSEFFIIIIIIIHTSPNYIVYKQSLHISIQQFHERHVNKLPQMLNPVETRSTTTASGLLPFFPPRGPLRQPMRRPHRTLLTGPRKQIYDAFRLKTPRLVAPTRSSADLRCLSFSNSLLAQAEVDVGVQPIVVRHHCLRAYRACLRDRAGG